MRGFGLFDRFLAWGILALLVGLMTLGGIVHATGSALACPDWPLCEGSAMPPMEGSVFYEHGHRLLGFFLALGSLALILRLNKRWAQPSRALGTRATLLMLGQAAFGIAGGILASLGLSAAYWGSAALLFGLCLLASLRYLVRLRREKDASPLLALIVGQLVILQAMLGGLTVLLRLPTLVSATHLATSMIILLSLVALLHLMKPDRHRLVFGSSTALLALAVYGQVFFGALVRHTGSGLACGPSAEALLCGGALAATGPAWLLVGHRSVGLVLALGLLSLPWWPSVRSARQSILAGGISLLALLQVAVAYWTLHTYVGVVPATLHLVIGGAILVSTFRLTIRCGDESLDGRFVSPARVLDKALALAAVSKPRLSSMVVITAAAGILAAPVALSPLTFLALLLGIALQVASANALNSVLEVRLDARMKRTQNRPLPQGEVSRAAASWLGMVEVLLGTTLLLLSGGAIAACLGLLSWAVYVGIYTPMKTRTAWALVVGAIPGALPPMIGYVGALGRVDAFSVLLFAIMFAWQLPHFLAISLYLERDYLRGGYRVASASLGPRRTELLIGLSALLTAALSLLPEVVVGLAPWYALAAAGLGFFFVAVSIRRPASAASPWARRVFLASLLYIAALFPLLVMARDAIQS